MKLLIDIVEFRKIVKEKCDEIIRDGKIANELYIRMIDIENDDRFMVVYDKDMGSMNNGKTL